MRDDKGLAEMGSRFGAAVLLGGFVRALIPTWPLSLHSPEKRKKPFEEFGWSGWATFNAKINR
jgi:hypothetical protein